MIYALPIWQGSCLLESLISNYILDLQRVSLHLDPFIDTLRGFLSHGRYYFWLFFVCLVLRFP